LLIPHLPHPLPLQECRCVEHFEQAGPDIRFALFEWSWFLLWAPLAGSVIAYLSRGQTIREVVAAVMFVPFCIVVLLSYQISIPIPAIPAVWGNAVVGLLAFLMMYWILKGRNTSAFFSTRFMPIGHHVK